MKKTIGIIGFGNMGSAIAEGIKDKYQVFVFDKDKDKTKNLSGIKISVSLADLANKVDTIILAVKPQDFRDVLKEMKPTRAKARGTQGRNTKAALISALKGGDCERRSIKGAIKDKLIISIAAGIPTRYIEECLGTVRVIRVMPNLPAVIGEGMSCICKGEYAKEKDLEFTEKLFKNLGKTLVVKEIMMNAVTAISGSGPGYYYYLIEDDPKQYKSNRNLFKKQFISYLTAAAEDVGFSHPKARFLSIGTGNACDSLLEKSGLPPEELKKRVASKGGTTEAGLKVLKHNIRNLPKAVKAALRRAKELSKRHQLKLKP